MQNLQQFDQSRIQNYTLKQLKDFLRDYRRQYQELLSPGVAYDQQALDYFQQQIEILEEEIQNRQDLEEEEEKEIEEEYDPYIYDEQEFPSPKKKIIKKKKVSKQQEQPISPVQQYKVKNLKKQKIKKKRTFDEYKKYEKLEPKRHYMGEAKRLQKIEKVNQKRLEQVKKQIELLERQKGDDEDIQLEQDILREEYIQIATEVDQEDVDKNDDILANYDEIKEFIRLNNEHHAQDPIEIDPKNLLKKRKRPRVFAANQTYKINNNRLNPNRRIDVEEKALNSRINAENNTGINQNSFINNGGFPNVSEIESRNQRGEQQIVQKITNWNWSQAIQKLNYNQFVKDIRLALQSRNFIQEFYGKEYTRETFIKYLNKLNVFDSTFYWKLFIKKLFLSEIGNNQVALTKKSDRFVTSVILQSTRSRAVNAGIIEIQLPSFPYLNISKSLPDDAVDIRHEVEMRMSNWAQQREQEQDILPHQQLQVGIQTIDRMESNYEQLRQVLRFFSELVGFNDIYDRLWVSMQVIGLNDNNEEEGKNIAFSIGLPKQEDLARTITENEKKIMMDGRREKFMEQFEEKTQAVIFNYSWYAIYIKNLQIFASQNSQDAIDMGIDYGYVDSMNELQEDRLQGGAQTNQVMKYLKNIGIFKNLRRFENSKFINQQKSLQILENKLGVFKQLSDEPCLFKLFRYFQNNRVGKWIIEKSQFTEQQQQWFESGDFQQILKLIQKNFELEQFGIYFYESQRWYNQQAEIQFVLVQKHIIISSREKLEREIYTKTRINKEVFVLKNKDCSKEKKQSKNSKKKGTFIGYYDIETYTIQNGKNKGKQIPYLLVLYQKDKLYKNFWGGGCIRKFLKYLDSINNNYSKVTIWSFNGSKFDTIYVWKQLMKNQSNPKIYGKPTNIKMMNFYNNIYFYDIKLIFSRGSLKQQSINWGFEQQKLDFDIKNKSKWYFEKFKKLIVVYCQVDCLVLSQIVDKFYELCENIQFEGKKLIYDNICTASQLSLAIFQQLYNKTSIFGTDNRAIFEIECEGYYGGKAVNLQKFARNLYYYDINSSYPSVLQSNDFPVKFQGTSNYKNEQLKKHYLYEVELEFHDHVKIPFIPVRRKNGLYYPLKIEKSWRWGVELIFGQEQKKFKFMKIYRVIQYEARSCFSEFITDCNEKKMEAKKNGRADLADFQKLTMNSLYGKLGQSQQPERHYFLEQDMPLYLNNYEIPIMNNVKRKFLNKQQDLLVKEVETLRQIDTGIYECTYLKDLTLNSIHSCVRMASYATRLGCVKLMEAVYEDENAMVYCDTDSIIRTDPLPEKYLDDYKLGYWKNEKKDPIKNPTGLIQRGYFAAPKTYLLIIDEANKIYEFRNKGIIGVFDWIDDGVIRHIDGKEKDSMEVLEEFMKRMIYEDHIEKFMKVKMDNQFRKKGVGNIFVTPLIKQLKLSNNKRIWIRNGEYVDSKPLYSI